MKLHWYSAGMLLGSAIVSAMGATIAQSETIKVGIIQPLSGDCAQWGVPITRGAELWAEELNEAGGIRAGDGKQYTVEMLSYDNICYVPGEELKAARRAILDDKVQFLIQTYTPASRQAIADLVTSEKVLTTSYGAGFLSEKYPYLMGGLTGSPFSNALIANQIIKSRPEAKRIALLMPDTTFGQAARAYAEAGLAPYGSNIEIVYNQPYDPATASDIVGLLTPLMATKPDVILELGLVPEQKISMLETANQFGFTGAFGSEEWPVAAMKERGIAMDKYAGRMFTAFVLEASEPTFSAKGHAFYERYAKKYGAAQWSGYSIISYAALGAIQWGIENSPTPDAETVKNTLYSAKTVDHPLLGPSKWGGEDIFGVPYHLLTPVPVYNVNAKGDFVVEEVLDVAQWWADNKAVALPVLKSGNQVFVNN